MKNRFVFDRSKDKSDKNVHFYLCRRGNLPFVWISHQGNYAQVVIDMITTDRNLDDTAIMDIVSIFEEFTLNENITSSAVECIGRHISKPSAPIVAERIYNHISNNLLQLPSITNL